MQDFFGVTETPRVGAKTPVLELWAPNGRAEQVTQDLESFWREHYPGLKRTLSRRYPKHHWPDDPISAPPVRLKRKLQQR